MSALEDVAPILPVRHDTAAVAHYQALGFEVTGDPGYRFARRGSVFLHLATDPDSDPLTTAGAAYIYVADADALFAEWADAGLGGRLHEVVTTDYGFREGAHVDPDGNLLRFGSRLSEPRP